MRKVIIHPGLPKTGTTALQDWIYSARQSLKEIGLEYPDIGLSFDSISPAHHNIVREHTRQLWEEPLFDPHLGTASDLIQYFKNSTRSMILSSEGLWTLFVFETLREHLTRMINAFSESSSVEIWLTLRNAAAYEESLFFFRGITGADPGDPDFQQAEYVALAAQHFQHGIEFFSDHANSTVVIDIYSQSVNLNFARRILSRFESSPDRGAVSALEEVIAGYQWRKEINASASNPLKYAIYLRRKDGEFAAVPIERWRRFVATLSMAGAPDIPFPVQGRCSFGSRRAYAVGLEASEACITKGARRHNVEMGSDLSLLREDAGAFFFEDVEESERRAARGALLEVLAQIPE